MSYTLDDLVDTALQHNTTLRQSRLSLDMSQNRLSSARINYLPDISARIGRTESFDNIYFEGNATTNTMGFSVSKAINLNNDDYFTNKNAQHDFRSSQVSHEIDVQKVIYDLVQSYILVLENQMRVKLLTEYISIQESIVAESNILFQQGKITPFEVQQSEINLLNARISNLSAANNLKLARQKLFDIVNMRDAGYKLNEIELYAITDDDDFSREIHFDSILSVRQQNETVERHRTNILQTKLDFFPQLVLRYDYGRTLWSPDFAFDSGKTDHTISLNLSYSLNRLLKNRYSYRNVYYLAEHNRLNTHQLLRDISQRYEQLIEELSYLQQMQLLLQNRLQQTNVSLQMAQQRYSLGRLTQLDLDKAAFDYLDAQINLENNRYALMLKKLSIDHLLSINLL
jgi:outer membrane protein